MRTQICFYLMSQSQHSRVIPPQSQPPISRVTGDANLPAPTYPIFFLAFFRPPPPFFADFSSSPLVSPFPRKYFSFSFTKLWLSIDIFRSNGPFRSRETKQCLESLFVNWKKSRPKSKDSGESDTDVAAAFFDI